MKRNISVVIIFAILLAFVIIEQVFVDNTLSTMLNQIDEITTKVDISEDINTEELFELTKNIDDYWTEKEQIMCFTINHNDLNRVGEQIKKIRVYVEQNNKEDCVFELAVLKFYTESYTHVMELNMQNIL